MHVPTPSAAASRLSPRLLPPPSIRPPLILSSPRPPFLPLLWLLVSRLSLSCSRAAPSSLQPPSRLSLTDGSTSDISLRATQRLAHAVHLLTVRWSATQPPSRQLDPRLSSLLCLLCLCDAGDPLSCERTATADCLANQRQKALRQSRASLLPSSLSVALRRPGCEAPLVPRSIGRQGSLFPSFDVTHCILVLLFTARTAAPAPDLLAPHTPRFQLVR